MYATSCVPVTGSEPEFVNGGLGAPITPSFVKLIGVIYIKSVVLFVEFFGFV
jgi:hypothetical protein